MASRGAVSHRRMFLRVASFRRRSFERQRLLGRELPLLDIVQAVGEARVLDVEVDVRLLVDDLVRGYPIPLHQPGVDDAPEDRHPDHRGDAPQQRAPAPEPNRDQAEDGDEDRQDHQGLEDGQLGVDVGIPGAEGHAPLGEQEVEHGQPVPGGLQEQHQGSQDQEVTTGPRGDREAGRGDLNTPGGEVHGDDGETREDQDRHQPAVEGAPEREPEHVEGTYSVMSLSDSAYSGCRRISGQTISNIQSRRLSLSFPFL